MPLLFHAGRSPFPARPAQAIPLGAALVIRDFALLPAVLDPVAIAESNPWAVVVALRPTHAEVLAAWRRHSPLRGLLALDCPEEECETVLRKELSSGGPPEPKEVVAYITAACPHPTFARALLAEFRDSSRPGRSARHHAFRRRGPLTATGWMGLYTITRALSLGGQLGLGDAAARLGVDPRTLRKHFHQVLGLDWRDARQGFGWKWAVEYALRRHGYLEGAAQLPLAFHAHYPVPSSKKGIISR